MRLVEDARLVAVLRVGVGPAFYVLFGAAVSCLPGRVRLISADVRDAIDVTTWPALLPYWGLEFVPGLTPQTVSII